MNLEEFMNRHELVALQFSSGKDSAACLKLVRPWIDKVVVIWCNPGDPYAETLEYMESIRRSVPKFIEAKGSQPHFVEMCGYPADSVPFNGTFFGRASSGSPHKISSIGECCGANLWLPLHQATLNSGATGVLRGERFSDTHRSSIGAHGVIADIEVFCPVYDWTVDQVIKFVGSDIPASYMRGLASSLDCRTCTAYLGQNPKRIVDLERVDPVAHRAIMPVLQWLREDAVNNLKNLEATYV
jgi:3'-phosphoadenosine 5'-phosphosulfate sulfotransferase (PAPS reductase)/FAD synthetase